MRDLFAHTRNSRVNSIHHFWGGLKTHDDVTLCPFAPRDLNPLCSAERKDAKFLYNKWDMFDQNRMTRDEVFKRCGDTRRTVQNYPPVARTFQLLNTLLRFHLNKRLLSFLPPPSPLLYSRKYPCACCQALIQWYSKVSGVCIYIDASNFISPPCNCIKRNFLLNAKRVRWMKEKSALANIKYPSLHRYEKFANSCMI